MDLSKNTILTPELFAEIKRLQILVHRMVNERTAGQYRSAFRGQGIEFQDLREYFPGDDIRSIDWKVTARSRKPYVKSYREERELTVMVAIDVSRSTRSGTRSQLRSALVAKLGAVLTLLALRNNDKVGLVTFSDQIETYHRPRKARSAIWRILHEVLAPQEYRPRTDIGGSLGFLKKVLKRSSVVFVISDFLDGKDFEQELAVLGKRHDVTAVLVTDPSEFALPEAGLVTVEDPESGRTVLLDTTSRDLRSTYGKLADEARRDLRATFRKHRIGLLELSTDRPFMHDVRRYFTRRKTRAYLGQFKSAA